jgi:hypothetical protein
MPTARRSAIHLEMHLLSELDGLGVAGGHLILLRGHRNTVHNGEVSLRLRQVTNDIFNFEIIGIFLVRAVGIEPTLLSERDFESRASTNSTTPAPRVSIASEISGAMSKAVKFSFRENWCVARQRI